METQTPPRPPFKVSGLAAIKHLNVRKEGPEEEKVLAVDIKLEIKKVDRRLCSYFDEALESFLWRGDTDALIARNMHLSPVTYGNTVSSAIVEIGNHSYRSCEVKKFSLDPRDGGVMNLTCSITLFPSASEVSDLAKMVQDEAMVSIEGQPDLFDGAMDAMENLNRMAKRDGFGIEISDSKGEVLATAGVDPMYEQAVAVVVAKKRASIYTVQRHLKIGYNRATRLIEDMERAGVVSVMSNSGSRTVLAAK